MSSFDKCEICGQPAVNLVRDLKETTEEGDFWAKFEQDGETHAFCAVHNREPNIETKPEFEQRRRLVKIQQP